MEGFLTRGSASRLEGCVAKESPLGLPRKPLLSLSASSRLNGGVGGGLPEEDGCLLCCSGG